MAVTGAAVTRPTGLSIGSRGHGGRRKPSQRPRQSPTVLCRSEIPAQRERHGPDTMAIDEHALAHQQPNKTPLNRAKMFKQTWVQLAQLTK
jgi:hypothetical protein